MRPHTRAEHSGAAQSWVLRENEGARTFSRLAVVETADREGLVTLDPENGEAVVWRVGYAKRKVNLTYRRLKPVKVREMTIRGATWRERRAAAERVTVSGA